MIRRYPYEALPRIAGSEKDVWRQLRHHLPVDGHGLRRWGERCLATTDVRLLPLAVGGERATLPLEGRQVTSFVLRGSQDLRLALVVDGSLASSLLCHMLGATGDGPRGSVTAGQWGLLAFGLAWLLSCVQTACPWSVESSSSIDAFLDGHADDVTWVEIVAEIGGERGLAWLLLQRATLAALPAREPESVCKRSRVEGVLLSVPVEGGRASLPFEEVAGLGVGDLLLFSACPPASAESYRVWLKCGRGGFAANLEGEQLTLEDDYQGGQPPMKSDDNETNLVLAEGIDVELVVELGRVEMTAAEVMNLGKGDVVTLQRALVKPVDLRVGGKLLGRAELVDVDGEAGIRIVELFDTPSSAR
ncbi:MAG: type III secretion system cytoplasmic ring protein SctQ [Deltaproteobacteria bacterium]|nr:type III secretion system cytoplasmic ring protein SctQ [Deltaproteobacteria bacterium]